MVQIQKGVMKMRYIPHEYQNKAILFALNHKRCMLSLDMGLG